MQRVRAAIGLLITAAVVALLVTALKRGRPPEPPRELRIVCSTFPIWQITRSVVGSHPGARVDLLLPAAAGCPHDYVMSPQDMRKLETARVVVVNGSGLDDFIGTAHQAVNPRARVIDATAGMAEALPSEGDADGHGHGDTYSVNPHFFASPRMAGRMAIGIARGLAGADPGGRQAYTANAQAFAGRMDRLADDFRSTVRRLRTNRIVTQHGAFDYLARDAGLQIVATVQTRDGQAPSAAELISLVRTARDRKAGAVFAEPQYAAGPARTVAAEAGIPFDTLDPCAAGPQDAPPDYYERTMRTNLATLERVLGARR